MPLPCFLTERTKRKQKRLKENYMNERHVYLDVKGNRTDDINEAASIQIEMKLIDLVHEVIYGMAVSDIPELTDIMDMSIEDVDYRAEIKLTLTKRKDGSF